jgi:signal transduction histidine kinase
MIRVLYAEDDPHVAEVVKLAFEPYASRCVLDVVTSGRECLAAMQRPDYDVLLLDLVLPDQDGLEVLSELVARRDLRPVIMVSGQGQHELAVRAMRAGAADCIDKNSPEFRRIPELALRMYVRHPRRSGTAAQAPVSHSVLFVDPESGERDEFGIFMATSVPQLTVVTEAPSVLESLLRGENSYDAVVLGPNLRADDMLAALRQLRAHDQSIAVIVVSTVDTVETTIAAFKLGAHDYLLRGPDCFAELVFSLNNALKQGDADKLNARLTDELARLNRSLSEQVTARTRDLESEVRVRREAERHMEENATRLQALSNRLLRVQEDERRSLAQELHDQIGQLLTGLRFQLESARQKAPNGSVDQALTITDELLRSVRAIALQLRPRLLDDLGLKPALEWHANVFRNQTGITVELELSLPDKRFGPDLEIAVFRMVQEALTNVARHSGATAASVTVTADEAALHVEVSDRGKGFDTAKALTRHDSLGLAGLAERVRAAGGKLDLFSQSDQGTRLHAEFDLKPSPS